MSGALFRLFVLPGGIIGHTCILAGRVLMVSCFTLRQLRSLKHFLTGAELVHALRVDRVDVALVEIDEEDHVCKAERAAHRLRSTEHESIER